MTNLQFASAICVAILIAIIHTIMYRNGAEYTRWMVQENLKIYRNQLEEARLKLELLTKLNENHKLIVIRWNKGSDDYIRFCNEVIDNCNHAEKTINYYLRYNQPKITRHAAVHLVKYMSHLERSIHEMDELVKKAR